MNKNAEGTNQKKRGYQIDEMVDEIREAETVNLEDGSELLTDRLTEEEKERILSLALGKIEERPDQSEEERLTVGRRGPAGGGGRRRRILAAALVAVFAFATTAFAAEVFQWDVRLSSYFGDADMNSSDLSGGGMNVGVSAENDGITVKAVQTIGDGTNLYILFDVTAPEGVVLDTNYAFDMITLRIGKLGGLDGPTGMGYGCTMIEDDKPGDNKATFLLSLEADKKINDKIINIKLENFGHYSTDSGEMIKDYTGRWELEWKLDYKDISKKHSIGKELELDGKSVSVDSISVSPIALHIQMHGSYFSEVDSAPGAPGAGQPVEITAITLKDGTVLTQADATGWGTTTSGRRHVLNMQMRKLLDPGQVMSVTLNDTEFLLP